MAFAQPLPRRARLPESSTQVPRSASTHLTACSQDAAQDWVLFDPVRSPSDTSDRASRLSAFTLLEPASFASPSLARGPPLATAYPALSHNDEPGSDDGLQEFCTQLASDPLLPLDQTGGSILPGHNGSGDFAKFEAQTASLFQPDGTESICSEPLPSPDVLLPEQSSKQSAIAPTIHWDQHRMRRIESWCHDQSQLELHRLYQSQMKAQSRTRRLRLQRSEPYHEVQPLPIEEDRRCQSMLQTAADSVWQSRVITIVRHVLQRHILNVDEDTLLAIVGEKVLPSIRADRPAPDMRLAYPINVVDDAVVQKPWDHHPLIDRLLHEVDFLLRDMVLLLSRPPVLPKLDSLSQTDDDQIDNEFTVVQHSATSGAISSRTIERYPFKPTLSGHADLKARSDRAQRTRARAADIEFWEQGLSLGSVFDYLARRFQSRQSAALEYQQSLRQASSAGTAAADVRSIHIENQHPLLKQSQDKATSLDAEMLASRTAGSCGLASLKRTSNSCASSSAKRSRCGDHGDSIRPYWEVDGSVDSASAALGGIGVWGEV